MLFTLCKNVIIARYNQVAKAREVAHVRYVSSHKLKRHLIKEMSQQISDYKYNHEFNPCKC